MTVETVRLDQWLWAARFFRTRALAKAAIEGGKVHAGKERCKVSRPVKPGDCLTIRQGHDERTVEILAVDTLRRSASLASALYRETPESQAHREHEAALRAAGRAGFTAPATRPGKHARRQLDALKHRDNTD